MQSQSLYHKAWERIFPDKWVLGLSLILLFGIPRFILVMNSYVSGQTQWVSIVFTLMCFTPLLFLKKAGRREMGIRRSSQKLWLLWGFLLGCGMCLLYFASLANTDNGSGMYFLVYMIIIMTFSPIGEELFYRGLIHQTFKEKFGERNASIIDSAAFALTHLAHFGIVYAAGGWKLLPLPALLWLTAMFFTCLVFNLVRRESGSILGAILTHAGFNFGMGFLFFYAL